MGRGEGGEEGGREGEEGHEKEASLVIRGWARVSQSTPVMEGMW